MSAGCSKSQKALNSVINDRPEVVAHIPIAPTRLVQ